MKAAVFLDRDGVINELVLNHATGEYEPPHSPENVVFVPGAIPALRELQRAGFELFLVSNQPDYAKGKATLEQIHAVHDRLDYCLRSAGIQFREYYYCYHHPKGIVSEYSFICECRKPKPYFLLKSARDCDIDLEKSWMIGDRDTDIECGKAAGTRTIMLNDPKLSKWRGLSNPNFTVKSIKEAKEIIIKSVSGKKKLPYNALANKFHKSGPE